MLKSLIEKYQSRRPAICLTDEQAKDLQAQIKQSFDTL